MNSAVKDKWGVGSTLDLSTTKAPIQYKRKRKQAKVLNMLNWGHKE